MSTFPAVLTARETDVFTDYDGIQVSFIGDDGGMVALGHHDEGAAQSAFHRHDIWGRSQFDISTTWAVLADPPTHDCAATPTTGCAGCDEADGTPWWMEWGVDQSTSGAFPVMVVEA
ncbi:hypothetical protein [Dactylosporangium sp. CA-139066]|uniref:hypothetical protein n=1 Tax=Dactylosporangium sp. CA-139066 TaxID=3239930 RepID=UPI003D948AF5